MNWSILTVGKPSFPWVREGVETYRKRLGAFTKVELVPRKAADRFPDRSSGVVLALDERGEGWTTRAFADRLREWELDRVAAVSVWIGGADGLTDDLRARADHRVALGPQTLMHELALLVWMEQLYRAYTLKEGHPYHREG